MILNTVFEVQMLLEYWSVSKNAHIELFNVLFDDTENKPNIHNIKPCDNIHVM